MRIATQFAIRERSRPCNSFPEHLQHSLVGRDAPWDRAYFLGSQPAHVGDFGRGRSKFTPDSLHDPNRQNVVCIEDSHRTDALDGFNLDTEFFG